MMIDFRLDDVWPCTTAMRTTISCHVFNARRTELCASPGQFAKCAGDLVDRPS